MFRIWANRMLKEFIIKGYVMDDARLLEPENFFGKDYLEEQLERIRDNRGSERRFYQKITDIYSQCSADYDVESPIANEFFATYAEQRAHRGNVMYMADWVKRLDAFLQFNEEDILHDKGKVTAAIAKAFAEKEFEKFRVLQDRTYQSEFDRLVVETSDDLKE